jgi:hypothetical protein
VGHVGAFWREVAELHDVILINTMRDLEPWLASCRKHFTETVAPANKIIRQQWFGCGLFDEEKFREAHRRHSISTLGTFGFNVFRGDGWKELCLNLSVDEPDCDFPKVEYNNWEK